jgi:hypothetical protein
MNLTSRLDFYRARVAESEEKARLATDPVALVTYHHAAKSWSYLAEHTEKREGQREA